MSNFASAFTPISVSSAKENIDTAEKFILFIGRPSCPYCQLFFKEFLFSENCT